MGTLGRSSAAAVAVALIVALTGGAALLGQAAGRAPRVELTVSAAISLKDALEEMARLYRSEKPDTALHFNLGASGTLQLQIEQGAPVDVFISAAPKQMDALESKHLLLPGTRKDLVKNRVVLIVPENKTGISAFQDLTRPDVKVIAVGEPETVPAGKYSREVLTHLGLYEQLKTKFVLAKDVRQVLTYVATGNADAGIVYATDAQTTTRVKVVATAPEETHSPVIYPVAVIKTSKNASAAKEFTEFLLGARSRVVFQKYGFTPAGP